MSLLDLYDLSLRGRPGTAGLEIDDANGGTRTLTFGELDARSDRMAQALTRRATLTRDWQTFFETYPVVLMPVSGELPFPDHLDRKDDASFARVWKAQLPQIAIPFMGLPGLTVTTGLVGRVPVGVQVVAGRFREDLCLAAGEAIEAGGVPASPVDPAS